MATQETAPAPEESAGAIRSAAELNVGDRVVYPNQGVCRILGRESKEIAGQKLEFVAMAREEDGATILVPVNKVPSIGLRKVADPTEVADVFDLLSSSFDDPELDWKVRHRTHGDLLSAGGVLGVAEVLKGLQALGNLRPLPQKERERYDAARHLLVNEISVALGVPLGTAEDYIDLALIPPPGTDRPNRKPRRLATLPPPRPRPMIRGGRPPSVAAAVEDLDLELEPDELAPELGGIEPEAAGEEAEEAETTEEAGDEEEAEAAPVPARPKVAAKAPRAEAPRAEKPAPAPARKVVAAKAPAARTPPAKAPKAAPAKARKPALKKPTKPAAKKPAAAKKAPAKKTASKSARKR